MRTFGGFKSGSEFFYGEVRGEDVQVLAKPYWIAIERTGEVRKLGQLDVDLPVAPSKLIAVGLNYADHIAEMKRTPLGTPLIWFKAPSSLLPHNGKVEIAFPEHQTDFETELAIVIGRRAKNVADVDVSDLPLELRQNGEVRQKARTSQMIYSVSEIVSFASQSLSLMPGDVILTGTPSGVGPIRAGDELEAQIGNWSTLRNPVINAN